MRETSLEISRVCEIGWDQSEALGFDQRRYAEQLLRLLGWEQPIPFSPREHSSSLGAVPYVLRGGQEQVAVYFVGPEVLEPPALVLEKRLDFCLPTRLLVDEAADAGLPYALITDFYRSYFYDTATEDLLAYADDPQHFIENISPIIGRAEVLLGSLKELRRQPRSVAARRLREWAQRWVEQYNLRGKLTEEFSTNLLDRLIIIRFLFQHQIMRRTRVGLEQRFLSLIEAALDGGTGVGDGLVRLFHDMYFDWRIDVFEVNPTLDEALLDDGMTRQLLAEFALVAESKFTLATVLESFNHGDPQEKLRVRMVPERNDERDQYLSKQSLATVDQARIEIDVMAEGYRAIFTWFDRVTDLYRKLEREFVRRTYGDDVPEQEEDDQDLFVWSETDRLRPRACGDKFGYACEAGFGIYCSTQRQFRISRLLLTLHLIEQFAEAGHAVDRFPSFRNVLMRRPMPLRAERLMNARQPETAERWVEW